MAMSMSDTFAIPLTIVVTQQRLKGNALLKQESVSPSSLILTNVYSNNQEQHSNFAYFVLKLIHSIPSKQKYVALCSSSIFGLLVNNNKRMFLCFVFFLYFVLFIIV